MLIGFLAVLGGSWCEGYYENKLLVVSYQQSVVSKIVVSSQRSARVDSKFAAIGSMEAEKEGWRTARSGEVFTEEQKGT